MLDAGAGILQWRFKGLLTRAAFAQAEALAALCARRNAMFIVNDRADLAAMVGGGLHLGQDDLPPAAARRVVGDTAIVGFSTHNEAQLKAAASEPASYLALGPIFGTSNKENPDPVVGLERLRSWRPLAERPLVAIGGITRENGRAVIEAGADSIALIGDLVPAEPTADAIRRRTEEWLNLLNR